MSESILDYNHRKMEAKMKLTNMGKILDAHGCDYNCDNCDKIYEEKLAEYRKAQDEFHKQFN